MQMCPACPSRVRLQTFPVGLRGGWAGGIQQLRSVHPGCSTRASRAALGSRCCERITTFSSVRLQLRPCVPCFPTHGWRLPALPLPPSSCAVVDRPRFGHRGVLLDTARNWFSVEDIKKKVLDPMHLTKMNVLKW